MMKGVNVWSSRIHNDPTRSLLKTLYVSRSRSVPAASFARSGSMCDAARHKAYQVAKTPELLWRYDSGGVDN